MSVDPPETSAALAERIGGLPFPILSDDELKAAQAFGVEMDGRTIAVPAVFVVSRDGRIAWRFVSPTPSNRPSVDAILEAVRATHR